MMRALSRFDVFAKLPAGDARRTTTGAALTLAAVLVMVAVAALETRDFLSTRESTSVALDARSEDPLYVQFVFEIPAAPCAALRVELHDAFGRAGVLGVAGAKIDLRGPKAHSAVWKTSTINGRPSGLYQGDASDGDAMENPLAAFLAHPDIKAQRGALSASHSSIGAELLDERDFDAKLRMYSFALVEFYSPRCLWCRKVAATYNTLAYFVRHHRRDLAVFKVDCDENHALCKAQQLRGVPTMRLFQTPGAANGNYTNGPPVAVADYMGRRTVEDMYEFVERMIQASAVSETESPQKQPSQLSSEVVDDAADVEGCSITGVVQTLRVPGSVRIVTELSAAQRGIDLAKLNLTHTLTHVSFDSDAQQMRRMFSRSIVTHFSSRVSNEGELLTTHEHHFAVVPVVHRAYHAAFGGLRHEQTQFEYSGATFRTRSDPALPEIRLSYDVASAAVLVQRHPRRRWYDFLTNLCAILGGVYTLARALDFTLTGFMDRFWSPTSTASRRRSS
uniref:Thioredoxin domain-containing protein n=1 Tax=Erythrolobus australicus TaxID=1077150 RepID=A0A6T5W812_9RHOD|mmetsp:Transcript_3071/g.8483  ORF Transcript_3071/g.8483 Transcript_3071/m.8483 type:complete len:506 (+) Transcript_3071:85-1602(+)